MFDAITLGDEMPYSLRLKMHRPNVRWCLMSPYMVWGWLMMQIGLSIPSSIVEPRCIDINYKVLAYGSSFDRCSRLCCSCQNPIKPLSGPPVPEIGGYLKKINVKSSSVWLLLWTLVHKCAVLVKNLVRTAYAAWIGDAQQQRRRNW